MHLETLKTFCDLVETGSLSRAARLNLVSQSAVSQQLRALERRYGRRLIERAPRIGARATDAGRLLYDEVKPLLERMRALEQRLRVRPDVVTGTVRVATVYSVGLHTLPPPSSAAWPTIPRSTCGSRTGAPTRCTRPAWTARSISASWRCRRAGPSSWWCRWATTSW